MEFRPNIFLTGFSGSGKSVIARELAAKLKYLYIDLDSEIEKVTGRAVAEIILEDGVDSFRTIERDCLLEVREAYYENSELFVMSLGGGTLLDPENVSVVHELGSLVWLKCGWDKIHKNLRDDPERPLLKYHPDLFTFIGNNKYIYDERVPGYSQCDLVVKVDYMTASDAATAISRLFDTSWFLTVRLWERTHPVICDSGLLARTGQILYQLGLLPRGLVFLITTDRLDQENLPLARIVREDIESTRQAVKVLRIPDGEAAKTHEEISRIHDAMLGAGVSRDDLIIALGGGTVADAAGFAAATYMRGIDLVQIPTTLVGMVDAALGGKTAINHPNGKNLIGAFHQPRAVLIDPVLLNTSADDYYLAGLAELIKYGCIADAEIVDTCEKYWADILNRPKWEEHWTRDGWGTRSGDPWALIPLIEKGVRIKANVVSMDEKEITGERLILNFGHTFAHAFEKASGFTLPHGQAVALGIRAAYRIGRKRGTVSDEELKRIDNLLDVLAPIEMLRELDDAQIIEAIKYDKKKGRDGLRYVLPIGIGKVRIVNDVSQAELIGALEELKNLIQA